MASAYSSYMYIFKNSIYLCYREGEKHQCMVDSHTPPTGDLAWNTGMCPNWELNQWSFGSQAGAQSTEPHQPGLSCILDYIDSFVSWLGLLIKKKQTKQIHM